nr:LacI family DNA-binding transcriptional regulator [Mesorhizobium sp.]
MAEVARRAGVSVSTVSHVINRTRFVSPEKAKLINDAIAAMGYQPNELARSPCHRPCPRRYSVHGPPGGHWPVCGPSDRSGARNARRPSMMVAKSPGAVTTRSRVRKARH